MQAQSSDDSPATDPPTAVAPQADEWEAATEAYNKTVTERRNTEKQINDIFSNLALGNRDKRLEQMKQIDQLKSRLDELTVESFEAAVNLVDASKGEIDRQILRVNLDYMKACMGGNKYKFPVNPERTTEICELLRSHGFPAANLISLEVHAFIATQKFEDAKEKINAAIEGGATGLEPLQEKLTLAENKWNREQKFRAEESDLPKIRITTSHGDITIVLYEDHAPNTVRNFISLINQEFYDGHNFFEIKRGQLVRSGCPNNNGSSIARYEIANEAEREDARKHFPGTISMVPNASQTTCCHQFLITQASASQLDGTFPAFGRVVDGMDVLDQIVQTGLTAIASGRSMPKIESIKVLYRRPDTVYRPDKVEIE